MDLLNDLKPFIRPHKRLLILAVTLTAVATSVSLVPPMILKVVIDDVLTLGSGSLLWPMVLLALCVPVLAALLGFFNNLVTTYVAGRLVVDLRRRLYGHLQHLPMGFYDRSRSGKVMERLMGDVEQVQRLVTQQTVTILTDLVACLVSLTMMLVLSPRLAVLPLVFVPVYVTTCELFRRRVRSANERLRDDMDRITSSVSERIQGTVVVKAFGQEHRESDDYAGQARNAQDSGLQAYKYSTAFGITAGLQTWLVQIGIWLLGYTMIVHDEMTLGALMAFSTYAMHLLNPAVRFAGMSNVFEEVMVSVRRVVELLREPAEAPDDPAAEPVDRFRGEVEMRGVGFEYEPGQPVLQEIDLHVPAGATVALVGHTGCGKTTLISLLYRFYDPVAGQIRIDGRDITKIRRRDLRRNLSLVPQDPVLFEGTIRENIAYGCPQATDEQILAAAEVAELREVIEALPGGLDACVGGKDIKLSVGQKQRLMIARAIVSDPAILVLDEATSSLDGHSESILQKALDRVMDNRTCFVIAHRLSTIVDADLIVVLDGGQILETGTHRELLERPEGHYRQLYLQQFAKVA